MSYTASNMEYKKGKLQEQKSLQIVSYLDISSLQVIKLFYFFKLQSYHLIQQDCATVAPSCVVKT